MPTATATAIAPTKPTSVVNRPTQQWPGLECHRAPCQRCSGRSQIPVRNDHTLDVDFLCWKCALDRTATEADAQAVLARHDRLPANPAAAIAEEAGNYRRRGDALGRLIAEHLETLVVEAPAVKPVVPTGEVRLGSAFTGASSVYRDVPMATLCGLLDRHERGDFGLLGHLGDVEPAASPLDVDPARLNARAINDGFGLILSTFDIVSAGRTLKISILTHLPLDGTTPKSVVCLATEVRTG